MKVFVVVWPEVITAWTKDRNSCRIPRNPIGSFEINLNHIPPANSVVATNKAKAAINIDNTMFKVSTVVLYDEGFQKNQPGCDFTINVVPI